MAGLGGRLLQARKQAEENNAVYNFDLEYTEALANKINEEQKLFGSLDKNGMLVTERGFADRINQWSQEYLDEGLERMPTGDAQQTLQQKIGSKSQSAYLSNIAFENRIIAENGIKNRDLRANRRALDLAVFPFDQKLSDAITSIADDYRAGTGETGEYSISQAEPAFRKSGRDAVLAYFDGLSKSKDGIDKGLRILNARDLDDVGGEIPKGSMVNPTRYAAFQDMTVEQQKNYLADFLDVNDFKRIRNELSEKQKAAKGHLLGTAKNVVEDSLSVLERGDLKNFNEPSLVQALNTVKGFVGEERGDVPRDEYNRLEMRAAYSLTVADAMSRAAATPLNQKDKIKELMNESVTSTLKNLGVPKEQWGQYGDEIRSRLNHNFDVNWKKMQSAFVSDPAKFILENKVVPENVSGGKSLNSLAVETSFGTSGSEESARQYFNAMRSAQIYKGISPDNVRLIPNAHAKAIVSSIENQENPTVAGATMLQLQNIWGDNSTQNFKQLTNMKNGLDKKYLPALHIGNVDYAKTAIEAIRNPNADKILSDMGRDDDAKKIDKLVPKEMEQYMNPILGAGDYAKNATTVQGIQKIVSFRAKQLAAQGIPNEEAVGHAAQEVIGQSFTPIGTTLVPSRIGSIEIDKPQLIDAEMKYRGSRAYVMANAAIPSNAAGAPSAQKLEQAIDFNRLKWTMIQDGSGARLEVKLKNGKFTPIFDKNTKKPITVDFIDIGAKGNSSQGAVQFIERN